MTRQPTLGILGGGQLARMTALAAARLGIDVRIFQESDEGPSELLRHVTTSEWSDAGAIEAFVGHCDVVTLDNEWVDLDAIDENTLSSDKLRPGRKSLSLVRNKIRQKQHAAEQGIPIGAFRACNTPAELQAAAEAFGFPLMVKRPTHSYDGYGNRRVTDIEQLELALTELGGGGPVIVEQWVGFQRELAVMVARRPGGETATYPVVETVQANSRCVLVEAPAPVDESIRERAAELARKVVAAYHCVGVVGVEFFLLDDGEILFNELAPRPHNSGHYTIEACKTSQFENHVRATMDLPLGDTSLYQPHAVSMNILGSDSVDPVSRLPLALSVPGVSVHLYAKRAVRSGRKLGHLTVTGTDREHVMERAQEATGAFE